MTKILLVAEQDDGKIGNSLAVGCGYQLGILDLPHGVAEALPVVGLENDERFLCGSEARPVRDRVDEHVGVAVFGAAGGRARVLLSGRDVAGVDSRKRNKKKRNAALSDALRAP